MCWIYGELIILTRLMKGGKNKEAEEKFENVMASKIKLAGWHPPQTNEKVIEEILGMKRQ